MQQDLLRLVLCLFFAIVTRAHAYHPITHSRIADYAAQNSVLNDASSGVLRSLGLGETVDDNNFLLPSSSPYPNTLTPMRLIREGSINEDDGTRALNHFFDPQNEGAGGIGGKPSPDWILEDYFNVGGQDFSFKNAREALYQALTNPSSKSERDRFLGRTFESLGHVIHHIQDMAQPQHVRDDAHCDHPGCRAVGPLLYRPSAYEAFTLSRGSAVVLAGYDAVDYGVFSLPRFMWQSGGMGIAEFTSNNFVSVNTNFRMVGDQIFPDPKHALPDAGAAVIVKRQVTDIDLLGPDQRISGEMWFIGTQIVDNYREGGFNSRTSTYSIFDDDLKGRSTHLSFSLNSLNFQAANEFLLPRAAGYSAGMIDYFFRGQIEISLPDDGVYSVVDHSVANQAGQGFTTLKVKLRNSTKPGQDSNGNSVPQDMMGGTLVAIANYTLNKCYRPDLAGEITNSLTAPSGCTPGPYLPEDEKVTQSAAIMAANLSTAATPFTFDFSAEPIPINARDLRIQVVYQGTVGSEADGIAIGSLDISAPTYLMIYNSSDYYNFNGVLKKSPEEVPTNQGLRNSEPEPLEVQSIQITGGASIAGSTMVPVNGYVRLALLVDGAGTTSYRVVAGFPDPPFSSGLFTSEFPDYPPHLVRNSKVFPAPVRVINGIGVFRGIPENHLISYLKSNPGSAALTPEQQAQLSSKIAGDPGPTAIPINF